MISLSKSQLRPGVALGFFTYRSLQVGISIDQETRRIRILRAVGAYLVLLAIAEIVNGFL